MPGACQLGGGAPQASSGLSLLISLHTWHPLVRYRYPVMEKTYFEGVDKT